MTNYIIFDFDGTIADSFKSVYKIISQMSEKYLDKKLTKKNIKSLRNLPTREIFSTIGFSVYKIPFVIKKIRKELQKDIDKIRPIPGMIKVLHSLKKRKKKIYILSSNEEINVRNFLKKYDLEIFDDVISGSSLFGKDKILRRLIRQYRLIKKESVYIGDETRDIIASKKVGLKSIAVNWGFNMEKILRDQKPEFLVKSPKQLEKILLTN